MKKNKIIFGVSIIVLLFYAINTKYGEIFMHINKSVNYIFKFSILAITFLTIFFPTIFNSDLYIDIRKGDIGILPDNPISLTKNKNSNSNHDDNITKTAISKNGAKSSKSSIISSEYSSTKFRRKVSESTKKYVASKQKWKCIKCKMLLDCTYEIDHIKPLYLNGTNDVENLQALCRNCHGKKTTEDRIFN